MIRVILSWSEMQTLLLAWMFGRWGMHTNFMTGCTGMRKLELWFFLELGMENNFIFHLIHLHCLHRCLSKERFRFTLYCLLPLLFSWFLILLLRLYTGLIISVVSYLGAWLTTNLLRPSHSTFCLSFHSHTLSLHLWWIFIGSSHRYIILMSHQIVLSWWFDIWTLPLISLLHLLCSWIPTICTQCIFMSSLPSIGESINRFLEFCIWQIHRMGVSHLLIHAHVLTGEGVCVGLELCSVGGCEIWVEWGRGSIKLILVVPWVCTLVWVRDYVIDNQWLIKLRSLRCYLSSLTLSTLHNPWCSGW